MEYLIGGSAMGFNYRQQVRDINDLCHLISDMDDMINELTEENERLETENGSLKDELSDYENL